MDDEDTKLERGLAAASGAAWILAGLYLFFSLMVTTALISVMLIFPSGPQAFSPIGDLSGLYILPIAAALIVTALLGAAGTAIGGGLSMGTVQTRFQVWFWGTMCAIFCAEVVFGLVGCVVGLGSL